MNSSKTDNLITEGSLALGSVVVVIVVLAITGIWEPPRKLGIMIWHKLTKKPSKSGDKSLGPEPTVQS